MVSRSRHLQSDQSHGTLMLIDVLQEPDAEPIASAGASRSERKVSKRIFRTYCYANGRLARMYKLVYDDGTEKGLIEDANFIDEIYFECCKFGEIVSDMLFLMKVTCVRFATNISSRGKHNLRQLSLRAFGQPVSLQEYARQQSNHVEQKCAQRQDCMQLSSSKEMQIPVVASSTRCTQARTSRSSETA